MEIRLATRQDKNIIARLMIMASGGLAEYLLGSKKRNIQHLLSFEIASERSPFSYRNCLVAEIANVVVGLICFYPTAKFSYHIEKSTADVIKKNFLKKFYDLDLPNSFYLDTLAVDSAHRRKGIVQRLFLEHALLLKENPYEYLFTYVWENNTAALQICRKFGFSEFKKISITDLRFPINQPRILMRCEKSNFELKCKQHWETIKSKIND